MGGMCALAAEWVIAMPVMPQHRVVEDGDGVRVVVRDSCVFSIINL